MKKRIAALVTLAAVVIFSFAQFAFAAFPSPGTPTATQFATSVTSMAVNLPASIASGDLLLAFVEVRNGGTWTVPSGWTQLGTQAGGGSVGKLTVFYKIADGTEGSTATWTASLGTSAVWQVVKVTSWNGSSAPEISTGASGDVSAANPSSLTPSWGADDTLWFAIAGHAAVSTAAWSAGPSGYSGFLDSGASSGGAAVSLASAYLQKNEATEDPGTFTVSGSNRFWAAFTVAVRPAGGASNSCTYSGSGDWNIKGTDHCYETGNTYVTGDCNFIGSGYLDLAGTISCQAIHGGSGFNVHGKNGTAKLYTR